MMTRGPPVVLNTVTCLVRTLEAGKQLELPRTVRMIYYITGGDDQVDGAFSVHSDLEVALAV